MSRQVEFVQNNILLVAVAFVSGAMLLWPLVRGRAGGPWVNTLQATQLMNREDAIVIDVRDAADYARGHILGAKSVPLADLARRAGDLDKHKSKTVIVHCENGNRSSHVAGTLRQRGFSKVHNLAGGFAAWQQAGLPVEK
jgi:rhodanese-related sulfurtransferase